MRARTTMLKESGRCAPRFLQEESGGTPIAAWPPSALQRLRSCKSMADVGATPTDVDPAKACSLAFMNKSVGRA